MYQVPLACARDMPTDKTNTTAKRYRTYPKYSDTLSPYHTSPKIWISQVYNLFLWVKVAGWVVSSVDTQKKKNSVDTDQTPRFARISRSENLEKKPR